MSPRVNLKARIKRHSSLLEHHSKNSGTFAYYYRKIAFFSVLGTFALMPFYPVLASFFNGTNEYEFYRGDIDLESILESYEGGNNPSHSESSFITVNTLLDGTRDFDGVVEPFDYVVQTGDTVSSLAEKYRISVNSILWTNDFARGKVLEEGEEIKIPPVSGIYHIVNEGEQILDIARRYGVQQERIESQNGLEDDEISEGQKLFIPEAKKSFETTYTHRSSSSVGGYSFAVGAGSQIIDYEGVYELEQQSNGRGFVWGNCTYYVAKYKDVTWRGNARDWLRNARNAGADTGNTPWLGAIVVFHGTGYNPYYGHVGIVTDVKDDYIIVKDMNYRRLNEVTVRKVDKDHKAIKGYIYVN